ncbi:hypothetical protein BU17DRAFT_72038 [Hysterangium stoloniferum]|nr:hypothetical protein BU17DRAFT_72038 [Hysterangium stoloniferum]
MTQPMASGYDPIAVESAWYDWWEQQQGFFIPKLNEDGSPKNASNGTFVIPAPPPNDTLIRWNRMLGKATLFVPGFDHAGISTQSVVEKRLYKMPGKTRHDLGREKFLETKKQDTIDRPPYIDTSDVCGLGGRAIVLTEERQRVSARYWRIGKDESMDSSEIGRFGTLRLLKRHHPDITIACFPIDDEEVTFGRGRQCSIRLYYAGFVGQRSPRLAFPSIREGDTEDDHFQQDDGIELGPNDAPDAADPPVPNIFHLAHINSSTEVNAAWSQPYGPAPSIASPVRQLDSALGLLNRKSEEIEFLKGEVEDLRDRVFGLTNDRDANVRALRDTETRCVELVANWEEANAARIAAEQTRNILAEDTLPAISGTHVERNNELREEAALFWESQVKTLEKEVEQLRSTVFLLKEQSRRTEDVRKRAALLPMAQQEAAEAREWKERVRNMGKDTTILRLEVMEWEDKEMARRKREKAEEEMSRKAAEGDQDEVVWVCPWMDAEHRSKCSVLVNSREFNNRNTEPIITMRMS